MLKRDMLRPFPCLTEMFLRDFTSLEVDLLLVPAHLKVFSLRSLRLVQRCTIFVL